jgi:ATP-binding cassette subfamily B protein
VHTEAEVTEALGRVLAGVTAVVVAHRASTVLLADKVALLDTVDGAGTITHIGTHSELLATVPRYRFLLAADDELDDGCEPRPGWEDDDQRRRLDRAYEEACEQRAVRAADYAASEGRRR